MSVFRRRVFHFGFVIRTPVSTILGLTHFAAIRAGGVVRWAGGCHSRGRNVHRPSGAAIGEGKKLHRP